jgi:hypothetical protein
MSEGLVDRGAEQARQTVADEGPRDRAADGPSLSVRVFAAFLAARLAFGLSYLVGSMQRAAIFWYRPLERAFVFGTESPGFSMEWFGRTAAALLWAIFAGAVVYLASGRRPFDAFFARRATVLAVARAGGLVLLVDFAYFGWVLMHQQPAPLPLPSWYCPR